MSKTRVWTVLGCCFIALAIYAWAQGMKAGLWETTSTMTWQKSPFQAMNAPAGAAPNSPFGGGTHTAQVCVTQEQIDKFGTVPPQTNHGCEVTNVSKTSGGMTADLTCNGPMGGTGTVRATFTDSTHTTSQVHFTGSMQMGPNPLPVEWTVDSTSVYKGSDCGSVKPIVIQ
jgi:hypothetical protein